MRSKSRRSLICRAIAAMALATLACAPARADKVATAGAANLKSISQPPGGALRVIEIGAQIVQNEKIETSASGSVQLLFIDKTTLNIGPNSKLVIDKFVFNPVTTQGELALSLSTGVLRVVGGLATHSGGGTITTPVASVGIRGGIVTVLHSKAKGTRAVLGYGIMTVTSGCGSPLAPRPDCTPQTVTARRPGFMIETASADSPPSEPARATAGQIDLSNSLLTSNGLQTGGSSILPTDPLAAGYNVGTTNSSVASSTITPPAARGSNLGAIAIATATQQIVRQSTQITAAVQTAQAAAPVGNPTASYSILTPGPYSTSLGSSPAPYLTGDFAGQGNFTVSPILGYAAGGSNADGTSNVTSRQFQAGLSVSGQGAAQSAAIFVMTSLVQNSPNIGFNQSGGFTATMIHNSVPQYGLGYGAVSSATTVSAPNSLPTNSAGTPNGGYTLNDYNVNGVTGTVSSDQAYNFPSSYTFNPVTASAPTPLVANHPNLTLQGYVGGMMVTEGDGYTAPYVVTNVSGSPGDVSIYLPGNSSQIGAVFNVASVNAPANALTTASYLFGSYSPTDPNNTAGRNSARGAYVNPQNFGARAATIYDDGANTPLSSRDGQVVSGGLNEQFLVTANSVGANTAAFLSSISSTSVQPCACESTQWGFWGAYNSAQGFTDQGNLLLWVAGVPTTAASLPTTGVATYTGHAIADISLSWGGSYLAAGTFSNAVNFGTRSGLVTIGGLDGANYTGTVGLTPNSTSFAGNLAGNVGSRLAAVNGSFFQGGATNSTRLYGEMGGSLMLTGTNYLGSGIFVARKP